MKKPLTLSDHSHFPSWAMLSGIAGMAGIIAMLVFSLASEYRGDIEQARLDARNITLLLEEHAVSVFNLTDLLAREVQRDVHAEDMKLAHGATGPHSKFLNALLKSQADSVPEVAVIHVANARGNYIYSSLDPIPDINIADRDYFKRQMAATAATTEPVISPPLISRTTGKWTLILSRRLTFADGRFAGIVLVILDLEYFQQFYHTLDLGDHGLVALFDNDLRLAARYPTSEKDMGKIANLSVKAYLDKGLTHGTYNAKSALDGIEREFAFRKLGNLPFIVFAGIAADDYLSEWRWHIWQYGLTALLFSLLVIGFVMLQRRVEVALRISNIKNREAEEEIRNLAFYDPLTQLPNRRLLLDRLKQAWISSARNGRHGALLFIDLDNFKSLNDTLGHHFGDLLLQQAAQRLVACVRKTDTVARLGGDEFVVMLEDLDEQDVKAAARTEIIGNKMLAALDQPYHLSTHVYHCTASIGITLFGGSKQQSIDELMKQADIAMYQAKKAGRNALRFFYPEMQEAISSRVSLVNELRRALENRQFELHYQIQVDSSHHPIGAEALIRWMHPEQGMISPALFIPLAEETGLIVPIGQWVIETACAQISAWQNNPLTQDLVLAVNVSAQQFRQAGFVARVQSAVQQHAIDPTRLKLELTEGMLLDDIEDTIAIMNTLSEIGILFSLDDFGTGYSSLQYLKRLPLDQIKIDQSFVRDIASDASDKAIVVTIIAIAHSLGLEVIAEGVETEEQRQFLIYNDCIHFQGYLFGKPVPIEQFEALLKQV
ncbi:MAG: EAL domain-containing protein [Gallionella sp.]